MPGLVPGIHVLRSGSKKDVDGRDKPGHDGKAGAMPDYFAPSITSIAPLTIASNSLRGTRARARIAMV
jgi:hypothetical protein